MIRIRPVPPLGMLPHSGLSRLGDFFLHLVEPRMYRISDADQDAALERASPSDMYRLSNSFPGTGGIVTGGGLFRIFG